ncbi:MAG: MotA/TolQ/ExbB proton channel family protein [Planctomycetes bacterium]|nr:MotA/TolQ/ExbB proton channel family protein [Planctomycetota bacterium]
MSQAEPTARSRRTSSNLPAFLIGVPLAAGILWAILLGPLHSEKAARYVKHPVECVEVVLFCCALGALGTKFLRSWKEWAAFRREILPTWDGQPVPASEADRLRAGLDRLPPRLQNTYLVHRIASVLDFLSSRNSAQELDDQLRALADNDFLALEGSFALTRFITWAIPILGFLGTVLGITQSISGVTPEVLEKSLSQVTDGLALAFDTTALGLALTMITMFLSFVVERVEQGVLEAVDRYVDRQLAHRFERLTGENGEYIAVLRQNTQVLLRATEQLVKQQAEVWAKAFEEARQARAEAGKQQQEQVSQALEAALEKTLTTHARRLTALENQVIGRSADLVTQTASLGESLRATARDHLGALGQIAQGLTTQTQALTQLQEGEKQLLQLQEVLNRNLAALAGAGAFEQAVHSLTAAIHLLTARSAEVQGVGRTGRGDKQPGAAA